MVSRASKGDCLLEFDDIGVAEWANKTQQNPDMTFHSYWLVYRDPHIGLL